MTFRVDVTPAAARDIEENATWWATHRSAEEAAQWTDAVRRAIDDLCDDPARLSETEESFAGLPILREIFVGIGSRPTHRIVFTVLGDRVFVLRVRHGSQRPLRPGDLPDLGG